MKLSALILATIGFIAVSAAEPIQEFRLPNGLRVLLAENHERPLVRLALKTAWDPAEEPSGKEGLGGFLADLLKANARLKREAFQQFLEDRALRFSFTMLPRSFSWSVLSDSQGQDGAFESLAMAATRGEFDGLEVEARRQSYLQAFKERTPRIRAEDRFGRRIGDPSRLLLPEEGNLSRIELQDLVVLSRRILRPEKSVLVIQGDMNLPQARQLAMLHLGAWGPSVQEPFSPTIPDQSKATRTWLIQGATQTLQVSLGTTLRAEKSTPASTFAICNWMVRRELASGLPPALAKAEFQPFPDGGWRIAVDSAPGKALTEVMEAVQKLLLRLHGKGIEAGELAAARRAWNAERRCQVLHPQQEAAALAERALKGDGLDEGVDKIQPEDLQAALRRLFSPEACAYFIIGAMPQDAAWLAKAGYGPVETVN